MELLHVALAASSEAGADAFYVGLLGLEKAAPKVLPERIARVLFGIGQELSVINYTGGTVHFEVFICPGASVAPRGAAHACIAVADLAEFLRKCDERHIESIRVPKGESLITFVKDSDGNLLEVKEAPRG